MRYCFLSLFICTFLFVPIFKNGCNVEGSPPDVLNIINATNNARELELALKHYQNDSLKLKALYFLLRNMDDQFHYEGSSIKKYKSSFVEFNSILKSGFTKIKSWDSIAPSIRGIDYSDNYKVRDIDVITSELLVNNIDMAFQAWNFPWAKDLNFEEFCNYILPYKLKNESLVDWRSIMMDKYKWVLNAMKNKADPKEAAILINNDLKKWFTIYGKFVTPRDLNINDLLDLKIGTCAEATQITAYAMRAMGIPVTLDFTPFWANRGLGHDWNCLLYKGSQIVFMGTENNPGFEKIEFSGYNYMGASVMKRKRAKIYRYSFVKNKNRLLDSLDSFPYLSTLHIEDVTAKFVPVTKVRLKNSVTRSMKRSNAYLCVFNNRNWIPICRSTFLVDNEIEFADMGKDIVYLPVIFENNMPIPFGNPFIITKDGEIATLKPNTKKRSSVTIYRKYPEDISNKIIANNNYEAFYWDNEWVSMGKQCAKTDSLIFRNYPANALMYIRNLDTGFQERIFTVENGQQIWW